MFMMSCLQAGLAVIVDVHSGTAGLLKSGRVSSSAQAGVKEGMAEAGLIGCQCSAGSRRAGSVTGLSWSAFSGTSLRVTGVDGRSLADSVGERSS